MTDYRVALETLVRGGVEFVVIGGVAATAHGSSQLTNGVDVVYRRTDDNIARLATALAPHRPYLRDVPPGLPFASTKPRSNEGSTSRSTPRSGHSTSSVKRRAEAITRPSSGT